MENNPGGAITRRSDSVSEINGPEGRFIMLNHVYQNHTHPACFIT